MEQALKIVRQRRENEAFRREVMEFRNQSPDHRRLRHGLPHPEACRDSGADVHHRLVPQGESGTGTRANHRAFIQLGRQLTS